MFIRFVYLYASTYVGTHLYTYICIYVRKLSFLGPSKGQGPKMFSVGAGGTLYEHIMKDHFV